jgi:C1A family cysteine protease
MRSSLSRRLLTVAVMSLPLFAACATEEDSLPTNQDGDAPLSEDNVNDGAPDNDSLPDDNKADANYPAKFEVGDQSPVKSQGSRGVCSIFATTALIENLYIKAGMPVAEADFSEQYMQWSSKAQQGEFTWTEGSSADANVDSVVNYGTVKEAMWPYETTPWSAANDAECTGGENLPTKCYTNGEPPDAAKNAQKYKVPRKRWTNTNSIKAAIHDKKIGVNVGMTFFYQSWNHRKSTLPTNQDYWRKGIVTYPNAKDKEVSLQSRAGHAIHLIGWDDNMEVESRDEAGNPILVNGVAKKEKGFWLFKNSWGTASFGTEHPTGAGYGWISYQYVKEYGRAVTADIPTLMAPREVCDDGVGMDEDGDGQANCSDADCSMHPSCNSGGGDVARSYNAAPNASIPDNNATGASSTIEVSDTGTITDAKVSFVIAHTYIGDLKVTLTKGTETITLHNNTGGATQNLNVMSFALPALSGKALAGTWTIKVVDNAAQDTGTLTSWELDVTAR